MPKQKHYTHDLVIIAVLSVITVGVWIGFSVYQSLKTSTISKNLEVQLQPLNPDFDTQVINDLNLRKSINQTELGQLPVRVSHLVEETAKETPITTATAQLSEQQESSPSSETGE